MMYNLYILHLDEFDLGWNYVNLAIGSRFAPSQSKGTLMPTLKSNYLTKMDEMKELKHRESLDKYTINHSALLL